MIRHDKGHSDPSNDCESMAMDYNGCAELPDPLSCPLPGKVVNVPLWTRARNQHMDINPHMITHATPILYTEPSFKEENATKCGISGFHITDAVYALAQSVLVVNLRCKAGFLQQVDTLFPRANVLMTVKGEALVHRLMGSR